MNIKKGERHVQNIFNPVLYFIVLALSVSFLTAEEGVTVTLDNSNWKVGYEENGEEAGIIELIRPDENILNWNELFAMQRFEKQEVDTKTFAEILKEVFIKSAPAAYTPQYKVWVEDPANIIETSFISKPDKNDKDKKEENEFNIGRLLKSGSTIFYVRYSTHDAELFDKNRNAWIERFKKASISAKDSKQSTDANTYTFSSDGVTIDGRKLDYTPEEE